jgi:NitT/TauT family transport system substrate-binding protein
MASRVNWPRATSPACVAFSLILAACGRATAPSTASPTSGAGTTPAKPSALASAATARQPERPNVKIVYGTASGEYTFVTLGAQKGFFERYGINADVSYAVSNVGLAALTSGEAQFNMADGVAAVQAAVAGSPTKVIASFDKTSPYALIGTPDIKAVTDLKGRTVAISKFGDTSDISLRMALVGTGVSAKDLNILQVGNSPARFAALQSKQVAGAVLDAGSFIKQAQAQGMNVLVNLNAKHVPYVSAALLVTQAFAKDNPNTVLAVLHGLLDSAHFFSDPKNKGEAMAAMAKDLKLDPSSPRLEAAYETYSEHARTDPYPEKAGIDTILQALRDIDATRYNSITADQVIDASFMDKLRAS